MNRRPRVGRGRSTDRLMRVAELLSRGAWQQAHTIVQQEDCVQAAWLHGIVHTIEGDLDNARHWYRKAGREFPGPGSVQAELVAARQAVEAAAAPAP